jgi:hypothetical protein
MSKSIRLLIASALTALAATSAHADFVYSTQGVDFTYHTIDADSFSLRIQHALDATGDWATATHLGYLGFKNIGTLGNLTGATVTITPAPAQTILWSLTSGELTGNGCNANANANGICLDASPDVALTNDLLFTIDLKGSGIDVSGASNPLLKASFTSYQEATRNKPAGFVQTGSLLGQTLQSNAPTQNLPEPASLALAGLALFGAAAARRRARS